MGYSKEHIARTRARILECAGRAFRAHGVSGVGIDRIMAEAGLTRGGFYAHFKSKAALFEAVVAEEFDFTNQIRRLEDLPNGQTAERIMFAVRHYLAPETRDKIAHACTMATLSGEVARGDDAVKKAFGTGVQSLTRAISAVLHADGHGVSDETVSSVIAICVGTLMLARAMPEAQADALLTGTQRSIAEMIARDVGKPPSSA